VLRKKGEGKFKEKLKGGICEGVNRKTLVAFGDGGGTEKEESEPGERARRNGPASVERAHLSTIAGQKR